MKIITPRLRLRSGTKKDINDIVESLDNINVSKWLSSIPNPYLKKHAKSWFNPKKNKCARQFLIELKSEKKVIGAILLKQIDKHNGTATTGYWLNEKYHNKGYGSEALDAILRYAFEELKLRRIDADVFVGNPSSGKILEKFGGVKEGLKRQAKKIKADGKIKDVIIYGILKEDWKKAVKKLK